MSVASSCSTTSPALSLADRLILGILFLFLAADVFDGALRFLLASVGAPWLIYIPKLLILAAFIAIAWNTARTLRIRASLLIVVLFFGVYLLVGVYYTNSWAQPAFGFFALLPFLYAFLAARSVSRFGIRILPFVMFLWACTAVGVLYDYFTDPPWSGLTYELAGSEIEGSRAWKTFGIERVGGFSRASFSASGHLLLFAVPMILLWRPQRLSSLLLRPALWLVTGLLILATTTKSTLGVYLVITLMLPFMSAGLMPRKLRMLAGATLPTFLVAIGILLPISTFFVSYSLDPSTFISRFLLLSLEDRLVSTWPDAFSLIFTRGDSLLGRGIGGIGVAQTHFEPYWYSPADNLYLYLYGTFGVTALLLTSLYTLAISRLDVRIDRWSLMMWFLGVAVLMTGWTGNCVEGPLNATVLGLSFGYALQQKRVRRAGRRPPMRHDALSTWQAFQR